MNNNTLWVLLRFVALLGIVNFMASCTSPKLDNESKPMKSSSLTRSNSGLAPVMQVYVETNDVNPLNAGDYYYMDGTPVVNIVEFFASNIHRRTVNHVTEPTLWLNPELTRLLEPDPEQPDSTGYHKYVKGLQDKGIKVLLSVIGNWQGIGLCNMNDMQTTQFAAILAHVVEKYGLDGIGFSDSYANYGCNSESPNVNLTSYSQIITKLHSLMPDDKLITVYYWGNIGNVSSDAWACVDYAYTPGWSGSYSSYIPDPLTMNHWAPISLYLGTFFTNSNYIILGNSVLYACENNAAAICSFNLRTRDDRDPFRIFETIGTELAYYKNKEPNDEGEYIYCDNGNRPQDWDFIPGGLTITYDDAVNAQ